MLQKLGQKPDDMAEISCVTNMLVMLVMMVMVVMVVVMMVMVVMVKSPPKLQLNRLGSRGGWRRSRERGSPELSQKPNRRGQNRTPRSLGGRKLERVN